MKKLKNILFIPKAFAFFLCSFCMQNLFSLPNFYDDEKAEILGEKIVCEMTAEELLSQIFMFGWKGDAPDSLLFDWIEKRGLGNVKVFGWNTKDSIKLGQAISELQKRSHNGRFSIPLFVATDQEGGLVRHVKGLAMHTPGNLALGATALPYDSYKTGYYIGMEMRALGINLNFAPAVDLYTNYNSSVIGIRSFGESAELASRLAVAFMKGAQKAGVISTAKHFPGHGDTDVDSHGLLPKIDVASDILLDRELLPFQALIDAGIQAIMTAHINYPALSKHGEPATFSKEILNGLLRETLKFNGIIITDDIMMASATSYAGGLTSAVRKAIEAGCNMVESSRTPFLNEDVWNYNINLMKKDKEFYSLVRDSAKKLLVFKLKYFKSENHVPIFPDIENISKTLPIKGAYDFFVGMAARSVTLIRKSEDFLLDSKKDAPLIISSEESFLKAGKKRFPLSRISSLDEASEKIKYTKKVIFCLDDENALATLKSIISFLPKKDFIVVSSMSPVYLNSIPSAKNVIAIYSNSPFSYMAAFSCIAGDFVANGTMPLKDVK